MSNNYVPNVTDLLAGELARATDINLRYSYVVSGFDKLPTFIGWWRFFRSGSGWRAYSGVPCCDEELHGHNRCVGCSDRGGASSADRRISSGSARSN